MNKIVFSGIVKNIFVMEDNMYVAYLEDGIDGVYIFWNKKVFDDTKIYKKTIEVEGKLRLIRIKLPNRERPIKIQAIQVKEMNLIEF